jgi:PBP1b-binding outer membrane lipoprotein LpoB
MKKLFLSKILLASLSVLLLNACSKTNDGAANSNNTSNNTNNNQVPGQTFEVAYVIKPLTSDFVSISFNDEQGNLVTVHDMDFFPSGTKKMTVSANVYTARLSVVVYNTTGHPIGFSLEIQINGVSKQIKNFTTQTLPSQITASVEYDVQLK